MEIHIGVVHTPKEISIEVDDDPAKIVAAIEAGVGADASFLWLEDAKGRKIGVPTDKIAYVELTVDDATRKVGFGL
jgi:Protein of unknown function (DUF3107)